VQAREIFERVDRPLHVGDCWMTFAQLEAGACDMDAAWAAAKQMTSWFKAGQAGVDRLELEQQVIALLEERQRQMRDSSCCNE
jgi:hypothetical protein